MVGQSDSTSSSSLRQQEAQVRVAMRRAATDADIDRSFARVKRGFAAARGVACARRSTRVRRTLLLGAVVVAACAGLRSTPETRYQGIVLDARDLGVEELRAEMARDERVRGYVEQHGWPDYLYVASPTDTELIYYPASRLVHFHRDPAANQTSESELTPLPTEVVNVLDVDLRAGTPGPISPEGPTTNCWTVRLTNGSCRTCCRGSLRCSTSCRS